jgi:hypothetical protein
VLVTGLYPLQGADEVSGEVVIVKSLSYCRWSLNRFETGTFVHTGVCFSLFAFFLSSLVWFFLWLPEKVLTLLFLLHCENGDFSILMKDIFARSGGIVFCSIAYSSRS